MKNSIIMKDKEKDAILILKEDIIDISTDYEPNDDYYYSLIRRRYNIGASNISEVYSKDYKKAVKNKQKENIPEKYIFNNEATILLWKDGTKTIIKKTKDDIDNKKLAFLIAYFQKNSGLTKNKANKYLSEITKKEG